MSAFFWFRRGAGVLAVGGELLLVIPGTAVLRVFAITGIDRMIPNFTSLDDALAYMSASGSNGRRLPSPAYRVNPATGTR